VENHSADGSILEMKVSGIKGGNAEIWREAAKLADKVFEKTVLSQNGRTDELFAVMVFFKECLHD
jgi:hypothetical protein